MDVQDVQDFVLLEEYDLQDYNEAGVLPQPPEVLAAIQKWLSPTDYLGEASEYNKHLCSYVPGTDLWIQDTQEYRKWHDSSDHGLLWIKAIAGAGKSVFAAMIAAKVAQVEKVPVLFFFFRQIVATNHDPHSLVRDWISMVLVHSPPLQAKMKKYVDDRRSPETISANEFWQDLVYALLSLPKVYCIIDALDEMDIEQDSFFDDLVNLGKQRPSAIKLLMTSRPLPRIETFLKDPSILQVRLEQLKVDRDITTYVDFRIKDHAGIDEEILGAIKQAVGEKAQGSFLYARLMMEEILDHMKHMTPKVEFIERSLNCLPATLEDMYNGMLLDHSLRSRVPQDLQVTILCWVTHSSRPLRLLEIAAMLDSRKRDGKSRKDTKAMVRAACGPLLEILEDETVSVIHHSFTEFLTDSTRSKKLTTGVYPQFPVVEPEAAHHSMALSCLNYLGSGCLTEWKIVPRTENNFYNPRNKTQQSIKMSHPFLDYAMNNWYIHVSKLGKIDDVLLRRLDEFMTIGNVPFLAWIDMSWPHSCKLSELSALHVASWAGIHIYVNLLIQRGLDGNGLDGRERTPLSWAATRGHTEVVEVLLKSISNPDLEDYNGLKPLHYAAQANHSKIVALLLNAGVSPLTGKTRDPGRRCGNSPSSIGHTPLMYACQGGCTESVREMMPYIKAEDLFNALCWAAESGKAQVVDLILTSPDATVEPSTDRDTPLFLAASGIHFEIICSLLDKGANPKKRSVNYDRHGMGSFRFPQARKYLGPTPLHALCGVVSHKYGRREDQDNVQKCFRLLFDAGSDINAIDNEGKTPLHYSVAQGGCFMATLSRLLLENGASSMAKDEAGNTPMHLIGLGQESGPIIELLLAKGADIEARRAGDGRTPIHCMVDSIHKLDIKSLLPHVSDWNIPDSQGNTALHIFLSKSYNPDCILQDLLDAGADPNRRNKQGIAPIHIQGHNMGSTYGKAVFPFLIKAGASLETKDNDGRTVLLKLWNGYASDAVQRDLQNALDLGANIHALDYEGNGILQLACNECYHCDESLINFLVDAGANPLSVNFEGNNLLHGILSRQKSDCGPKWRSLIVLFMNLGVPIAGRNNLGQTPFHLACGNFTRWNTGHSPNDGDPLDFILQSPLGASIDEEDNQGISPIHLAATISEVVVARLIKAGAITTKATSEGRNLLHIAAVSRQPNIIGLLLEHYAAIGRSDLVNFQDDTGRSPLHDACRSGRPETVALLLKAGADPNIADKKNLSPLHACAEFNEENLLWSLPTSTLTTKRKLLAAGILKSDPLRPTPGSGHSMIQIPGINNMWSIDSDHDTVRIGEIVTLLIDHGAGLDYTISPMNSAISLGCVEMVATLADLVKKHAVKNATHKPSKYIVNRESDGFRSRYLIDRSRATVLQSDLGQDGEVSTLCNSLLATRNYSSLKHVLEIGGNFAAKPSHGVDVLTILIQWGFASLLEELGESVPKAHWIHQGSRNENTHTRTINPYIITATHRELPNCDVIKVLVEKFGVDVNIQPEMQVYRREGGYKYLPGGSALHVLALGTHWWHTQAIEYLLKRGANTELKNERGQTPLHVAVSKIGQSQSYRNREVTKILLESGADPNAMDENGLTCLNQAMHNIELVQMLIKYGADINLGEKPVLHSAITLQQVEVVAALLESGADCNVRPKQIDKVSNHPPHMYLSEEEQIPLRYAANPKFNTATSRETATQIIRLLLNNGADPFQIYGNGLSIIHEIFQYGGILQPFLELPGFDMERRDPNGCTIFLASCKSSLGVTGPISGKHGMTVEEQQKLEVGAPLPSRILYDMGADLLAVDNWGNNALHHLLSANPKAIDEFRGTLTLFIEKAPSLVTQKNAEGYTPFHSAMVLRMMWPVTILMEAGANVLEKDPKGNTPLHYLASVLDPSYEERWGWTSWWKTFLDLGISINEKNNRGETALFSFFSTPWTKSQYKLFEDAGADIFARNNEGETLLHIVAKKDPKPMFLHHQKQGGLNAFKFLMKKGLDPMVEDNYQRTALDVAAASGNEKVLALFKRDKGAAAISDMDDDDDEVTD